MSRKIVAIGGGENGRKRSDGTRYPSVDFKPLKNLLSKE